VTLRSRRDQQTYFSLRSLDAQIAETRATAARARTPQDQARREEGGPQLGPETPAAEGARSDAAFQFNEFMAPAWTLGRAPCGHDHFARSDGPPGDSAQLPFRRCLRSLAVALARTATGYPQAERS